MNTETYTAENVADNFLRGVLVGAQTYADVAGYETTYGPSEGFVYFIAIGEPHATHIKIGFTRKNPHARLRDLQTGCPLKMRLMGFVLGTAVMERELHDVLRDDRLEGEWFAYTPYVASIIEDQLTSEAW